MSIVLNGAFFICAAFISFYVWLNYRFGYWKRKNVFSPPASFPSGHIGGTLSRKLQIGCYYKELYNQYKHLPFIGLFLFSRKALLVNNLDLIKNILTKDFLHFQGHGIQNDSDPLSRHLFNLEGEEWKRIRVKLTPTFTSSKMKYMFDTILSCTQEMVDFLNDESKISNVFDVKELIAKLGTNVIGSCAFGIETNCFQVPDSEFRKMGKVLFQKNLRDRIVNIGMMLAPNLLTAFNIHRSRPEMREFFFKLVRDTVEYREKNNIKRNDFLQLLIDMKNADEKTGTQLNLNEITAQVFVFYIAGFETSSTAATYALLELAKDPKLRKSVCSQIDSALDENGGNITYELLTKMTFLNNLVNETLRLYPPLPFLFRGCTKDYAIPNTSTVIEKNTFVIIPIMGIQRDPDIYPDPDKFDPERYTTENVQDRHFSAHLPFGEGPRICIGNRFGLMQVKLALLMILKNFDVELSDRLKLPVEFDSKAFLLHTKGEMFLKLTPKNGYKR